MANKRIFYACRRVGIAPCLGTVRPNFQTLRGVQSAGLTTSFKLEQVFELGQLAVYDNFEGIPDIEIQMEKVLDGYCPVYLLATQMQSGGTITVSATLAGRAPTQCIVGMQIYDESLSIANHLGVAENASGLQTEVNMSGMYVSSIRYQCNVERHVTETVGFVGNNKAWVIGGTGFTSAFTYGGGVWDARAGAPAGETEEENLGGYPWTSATNATMPLAVSGLGGIQRRQNVLMDPATAVANGAKAYCILPGDIAGVVLSNSDSLAGTTIAAGGSGQLTDYGSGTFCVNPLSNGSFNVHIQTWNVHVDLGREQLHELGRLGNYYRYVNWPVEVTNEIAVLGVSGDMVSAAEEGIYTHSGNENGITYPASGCGLKYNLKTWPIRLALCEGLIVDCGKMNKLKSVGMTGGDTGRGNVEMTYTYSTFNDFTVLHPQDVVTALRP